MTCNLYDDAAGLYEHGGEQLFSLLSLLQLVRSSITDGKCVASSIAVEELDGRDRRKVH